MGLSFNQLPLLINPIKKKKDPPPISVFYPFYYVSIIDTVDVRTQY